MQIFRGFVGSEGNFPQLRQGVDLKPRSPRPTLSCPESAGKQRLLNIKAFTLRSGEGGHKSRQIGRQEHQNGG